MPTPEPDLPLPPPDEISSLLLKANYEEAARACRRSLPIREHYLGFEHPHVAESLDILAELLRKQVGNTSQYYGSAFCGNPFDSELYFMSRLGFTIDEYMPYS